MAKANGEIKLGKPFTTTMGLVPDKGRWIKELKRTKGLHCNNLYDEIKRVNYDVDKLFDAYLIFKNSATKMTIAEYEEIYGNCFYDEEYNKTKDQLIAYNGGAHYEIAFVKVGGGHAKRYYLQLYNNDGIYQDSYIVELILFVEFYMSEILDGRDFYLGDYEEIG